MRREVGDGTASERGVEGGTTVHIMQWAPDCKTLHTLYLAYHQTQRSMKPLHCQPKTAMHKDLVVCGANVAEHTPSIAGLLDVWRNLSSDMDATSLAPETEFCVIISSSTRSIAFPKRQSSATIRSYRLVKRCSTACITGHVIRSIK
jgi:hypothetical protein